MCLQTLDRLGLGGIAAGVLPLLALGQAPTPLFSNAEYFTGEDPRRIVAGDFDSDGRLDLATANWDSIDVSILLADGLGGFRGKVTYPVPSVPRGFVTADVDSDGDLDLVLACSETHEIVALLGNGAGGFVLGTSISVGAEPWDLAVADFDLDGKPDFVTADFRSASLSVRYGDGHGGALGGITLGVGVGPRTIALGDFNEDGRTDIAIGHEFNQGTGSVGVLLAAQGGGFSPMTLWNGGDSRLRSMKAGDLNVDGHIDLAVINLGGPDWLLKGNGAGAFTTSTLNASASATSIEIADFDRDGLNDLLSCESSQGITMLRVRSGQANGTLVGGPTVPMFASDSFVVGDFDQDGILDVAAGNWDDNLVAILRRTALGAFQAAASYPAPGIWPLCSVSADFNGDGQPDLAIGSQGSPGIVRVALGNGMGGFSGLLGGPYVVGWDPYHIEAGDIDLDGRLDLLTANVGSNSLSILHGLDGGSFGTAIHLTLGASRPSWATIADLNLDNLPDVICANINSNDVSVFLATSPGNFGLPVRYTTGVTPSSVVAADFNGDGYPDLLTTDVDSNSLTVLQGTGQGTFQISASYSVTRPGRATVADLNADGRPDVAAYSLPLPHPSTGTLEVWLQTPVGMLEHARSYETSKLMSNLVAGDVDGDGFLDLAYADSAAESVGVFLGNGTGAFPVRRAYVVAVANQGSVSSAVQIADVDHDGRMDLVTTGVDNIAVLRNVGTSTPGIAMCFGSQLAGDCPCSNWGAPKRGCENSSATGGAWLASFGTASLANDSLTLASIGQIDSTLSILLQGSAFAPHSSFGDGLRCAGGSLVRLYVGNSTSGIASSPPLGSVSISTRAAELGDSLTSGSIRLYQSFYRDPVPEFCATGGSFNLSSGQQIVWNP